MKIPQHNRKDDDGEMQINDGKRPDKSFGSLGTHRWNCALVGSMLSSVRRKPGRVGTDSLIRLNTVQTFTQHTVAQRSSKVL